MKTKILTIVILTCMHGFSFSEEPIFRVTKEKLARPENTVPDTSKPDAEFRIKLIKPNKMTPDLVIPTYSTGRRRVVDFRVSQERMEVAIQLDELGIDYYDYKLVDEKWLLQSQKRICSLSGARALALAQVDIREGGVVEIRYREGTSERRKSTWNDELINKDHKQNEKLLLERYDLKPSGFVLVGEPVRLRPNVNNPQTTEEKK